MNFTLYQANCTGQEKNTLYPNIVTIGCAADLADVVAKDHTCGKFKGFKRSKDNFLESDVEALDIDNDHSEDPDDWITVEKFEEEFGDVRHVIVFSRHNNKEKDGKAARPRFHVFFPHKKMTALNDVEVLKQSVQAAYPFFDKNCLDGARFLYGSTVKPEDIIWHEGQKDITDYVAGINSLGGSGYTIPQGERNSTMSHFAGRIVKKLGIGDIAKDAFFQENTRCNPPLSHAELEKIWASACKFWKKVSSAPGYIPPQNYNGGAPVGNPDSLKPEDYSDIGQAKVLSAEEVDELKYNQATGYLFYNGVNWEESLPAAVGAVERFLDLQLAAARQLVFLKKLSCLNAGIDEAGLSGKRPPEGATPDQVKVFQEYLDALSFQAFVMKRRDMRYVNSAMDAAKPMLFVKYGNLDKDEFLLNTLESTYDLRLGLMGKMSHKSSDLCTKVTLCEPGDKGKDIWEEALHKTFCNDAELEEYVQQVCGLAAIGKVYVEALIIAYGEGRNGKSTFFNTVARVLGSYSWSLSSDALIVGCRRNVKWEITELKGRRFVIAAELEEGTRLSTSMLKQITSTDDIQGEKKFKDPSPFTPSHTTILFTNHLPKVGATDAGTWRRLIVIPFNAVFENSGDTKNYADYLVEEAGPAVLSWIIEGAEKVIACNFHLKRPKVVQDAINAYKEENDWMAAFLNDCCEVGQGNKEKAGELYQEYRSYCDRIGEFTRSNAEFSNTLENLGYEKRRTKNGFMFYGLKLKSAFDED